MSTENPDTTIYHHADPSLSERAVVVHLVGVGGTGSQILTGLARLHVAMLALGHPAGLDVRVFDMDTVSPSNVGRQLYSPADIGQSKAITLTTRVNCFMGTAWKAYCDRYTGEQAQSCDILITCVDTAASRREIAKNMGQNALRFFPYWLDCGNSRRSGQVFLTQGKTNSSTGPDRVMATRFVEREIAAALTPIEPDRADLPTLWQVLPEIFDESIPEDDTPSCSLAESLRLQDLFINDHISRWALHLLWVLLSEGKISTFGYWINLEDGRVAPVPVRLPELVKTTEGKGRKCKGGMNG